MRTHLLGLAAVVGLASCVGAAEPAKPADAHKSGDSAAPLTLPPTTTAPLNHTLSPDCGGDCCPPTPCCDCLCGPPGRFWVGAEWLYWATSGNSLPVLATASPPGTPLASAGVLGAPGTTTLIGGSRANTGLRSGLRFYMGMWLDDCQKCGIESDFFFLGRSGNSAVAGDPSGTAIVSRPFFNALTGLNAAELVSFPGVVAGTVSTNSSTNVIGGGPSMIKNICCNPCVGRVDFIGGFRYLHLDDDVTITENLVSLGGSGVPAGSQLIVQDRFKTTNDFYGANVGLRVERWWGRCFGTLRGSIAMGVSHETVTISGSTTTIPAGGGVPVTLPGGLYAQSSNIGTYESDKFAVIPEVGFRLGVQATNHIRVWAGYSFIYWSNVARAGDQIDQRVNPNLIPPATAPLVPAVPAPLFRTTDYWLQGVSIGGELRF